MSDNRTDPTVFFTSDGIEACRLTPPLIEVNGRELRLDTVSAGAARAEYSGQDMTASDMISPLGEGLYLLERVIKNTGRGTRTFKLICELETAYVPTKYNIPCVSYGGNARSGGKEYKGTELDGETWIYAYDRTGIPSCTEAEDDSVVTALFASEESRESLRSSCSFAVLPDGRMAHRIYYPVTEAPYTYCDHDIMCPRYDEYITLGPGGRFSVSFYIYISKPKWKNYGMANVLDTALGLYNNLHEPSLSPEEVWDCSIAWSEFLLCDFHGAKMFRNMFRHAKEGDGLYTPYDIFEAGWSGQCMQQARMFILEYKRTGEQRYLDDALSCLDAWVKTQKDCGLFPANYARHISGNYIPNDICNYSWGAIEMIRSYALLRELGIERPEYVTFARRVLDFLISQYTDEGGFGLSYTVFGEKAADGGSIGGFTCMALVEFYKLTNEKLYLDMAVRSFDMYFRRDLDDFICTAGAIDCSCIDKETAYPFIYTALELYDITKETVYLERAQKAAYYFFSWAFHYDALYPDDSDFSKYGYYTSGGTAISTQHPAIDPWGEIAVPDFVKIAEYTGDERWLRRARMMWNNAILCITSGKDGDVKLGHKRPYGAQSEAFFQARWTRGYRPDCEQRGHINDMFVGWVSAYRLSALERMSAVSPEGIDLLR